MAPATYNSLNKLAAGNRRWRGDPRPPPRRLGGWSRGGPRSLVAPTMHGSLQQPHPGRLAAAAARAGGAGHPAARLPMGKHNLPDDQTLVAEVARAVSRSSLRGRRILVTGGSTPVPIDGVRRTGQPLPRAVWEIAIASRAALAWRRGHPDPWRWGPFRCPHICRIASPALMTTTGRSYARSLLPVMPPACFSRSRRRLSAKAGLSRERSQAARIR